MDNLSEVVYTCSNQKCRHTQTMTYFAGDQPLPVLCCVKCRAGFGVPLAEQTLRGVGMFPGKARHI